MNPPEPIYDIAHLGHVELLTPKPEESEWFFVEVMGMTKSDEQGDSVYLRGWDDYEHHTLKVTASKLPGLGHYAFRARSPQALQRRVAALEGSGYGQGWHDGDLGHGPAYRFKDPDGHNLEIYYETEWYTPPETLRPALKNQTSRFPARGVNLRRLDHINLLAVDIPGCRQFMQETLGCRLTEHLVFDDGSEKGVWLSVTQKSYDVAIAEDHTGVPGRFHHVTYAVDSREEVLRAADICLEHGVFIETGPHKHAFRLSFCTYMNRVATVSRFATLVRGSSWRPTGKRSSGARKTAKRGRHGAYRRLKPSTPTEHHRWIWSDHATSHA